MFEVHIPDYSDREDGRYQSTLSGFYNDPELAAKDVVKAYASGHAVAAYITLNEIAPELLAVAANRLKSKAKKTTADTDVIRRTHLLIDVDPVRISGISSTDTELQATFEVSRLVREFLSDRGWPMPIETASGNGAGLIYNIDLPADDGGKVQRVLAVLAKLFDTDKVKVDTSVFNEARVTKLVGTPACKGEHLVGVDGLEDRPHRISRLLNAPEEFVIVQVEQIQTLIADFPEPETSQAKPSRPQTPRNGESKFERFPCTVQGVEGYLRGHNVSIKGIQGNKIILACCVINPECQSVNGSDIAVLVGNDGTIGYKNLHNRGAGLTWVDVREKLEPGFKAWKEGKGWERQAPAPAQNSERAELGKTADIGEPIPLDSHKPPEFPDGIFCGWLGDMIDAVSLATETPKELGGMMALPPSATRPAARAGCERSRCRWASFACTGRSANSSGPIARTSPGRRGWTTPSGRRAGSEALVSCGECTAGGLTGQRGRRPRFRRLRAGHESGRVGIQFAPRMSEFSRMSSCYMSAGHWPVAIILRPIRCPFRDRTVHCRTL